MEKTSETDVEEVFHPILELIQDNENYAGLLTCGLEVREHYKVGVRFFRRGAENTALNNGVKQTAIKSGQLWDEIVFIIEEDMQTIGMNRGH